MAHDKLQQKIREAEDEHSAAVLDGNLLKFKEDNVRRAMFVLGGINIAGRIAASLGSQEIRTLIRFQEEKLYEGLGFETFVDFLNSSEYSPMTKSQFYERKAVFEKEGDQLFDLLTDLGVSIRNRKLLGKGSIQLEGDNVIVTTDGEETTIDLTDRKRLLETLTALADANADKSAKLDKQAAAIAKHGDEKKALYDDIDRVKASKIAEVGQDPHSIAVVNLNFAYRALIESVEDMTPIEREQFAPRDFELIAARNADLAAAFGRSDWTKIAPAPAAVNSEDLDDVDDLINRVLEDDDNDAELAESL